LNREDLVRSIGILLSGCGWRRFPRLSCGVGAGSTAPVALVVKVAYGQSA
jgi:hypothetical protein